jgi:metal-dependent amidase/aminoacylase/carboxypeptidase family protein
VATHHKPDEDQAGRDAHREVSIISGGVTVIDDSTITEIDTRIDRDRVELARLARAIHDKPELRFEEHEAAQAIATYLERAGFEVERGLANMPTSLRARAGNPNGPRVAVLAEYDALPEIGHACGHNLIAAAGVGAFLGAAAAVTKAGGEIVLLGTPAEEGGVGRSSSLRPAPSRASPRR